MAITGYSTSNYLSVGSVPTTATAPPLTMACWAYTPSIASFQNIMGLFNSGSVENRNCIKLNLSATGRVRASSSTGSAEAFVEGPIVSANTWFHMAGTFIVSAKAVFFNGTDKTTQVSGSFPSSPPNRIFLGCGGGAPMATPLNSGGMLADVGIWDVVLTDEEIIQLSTGISASLIRPQSLVFYAPLIRDIVAPKYGGLVENGSLSASNHPRIFL